MLNHDVLISCNWVYLISFMITGKPCNTTVLHPYLICWLIYFFLLAVSAWGTSSLYLLCDEFCETWVETKWCTQAGVQLYIQYTLTDVILGYVLVWDALRSGKSHPEPPGWVLEESPCLDVLWPFWLSIVSLFLQSCFTSLCHHKSM